MVHAHYCAPYPKQPYVEYEVNICYDIICSRTFYSVLPSLVINSVTTPLDCDWCDCVTDHF